jgi:hypothetical protein
LSSETPYPLSRLGVVLGFYKLKLKLKLKLEKSTVDESWVAVGVVQVCVFNYHTSLASWLANFIETAFIAK